jgi:hypothetical protein
VLLLFVAINLKKETVRLQPYTSLGVAVDEDGMAVDKIVDHMSGVQRARPALLRRGDIEEMPSLLGLLSAEGIVAAGDMLRIS